MALIQPSSSRAQKRHVSSHTPISQPLDPDVSFLEDTEGNEEDIEAVLEETAKEKSRLSLHSRVSFIQHACSC